MSDFHKKRFEFMSDCDETRYNKEMIKYNDEKKILDEEKKASKKEERKAAQEEKNKGSLMKRSQKRKILMHLKVPDQHICIFLMK